MERIVITLNQDGTFRGASVNDFSGLPQPLDVEALAELFPTVDAASLARVAELEVEVAGIEEKDQQIASLTEQAAALQARIDELTAPPTGPQPIKAWQAKAVLALAGLLDGAVAVIDSLDEPQKTVVRSAWDNNADFARDSQTVLALAAALQLTDEQLDGMFAQAAALTV